MRFSRRIVLGTVLPGALVLVVTLCASGLAAARTLKSSHVSAGSITLVKLYPASVRVGERFNYQTKSGQNALSALSRNAPVGTSIVFDGHVLPSAQEKQIVSALIPNGLVSKEGRYPVYLQFRGKRSNSLTFVVRPGIKLLRLYPSSTRVGAPFNYQPKSQENALSASSQNAPVGTSMVFDGHVLPSVLEKNVVSALIPNALIAHPGHYSVYLQFQNARSNVLTFNVMGPPTLLRLYPAEARVGQRFNYQTKQGQNALSAAYRDAGIGTSIVFDGHVLSSVMDQRTISALVPNSLLQKPRNIPVYLRYQGSRSNSLTFVLKP